jgi:hypothetical protein
MPRWSDDPTQRLDDPALAPDAVFARGAEAADAAVAAVVDRVRARSRLRAVVVRFALRRMRRLTGMRETHKDYLVRLLAHARVLLATIGTELATRGLLDRPDDVFFLDLAETRTALTGADLRALVAARRAEHNRELRRRHVPRVLLSDGTEPEAVARPGTVEEGALTGTTPAGRRGAGVIASRVRSSWRGQQ